MRFRTVTGVQTCALPIYKLLADLAGQPMYTYILERLIRVVDARPDTDDLIMVCRPGEIYTKHRHDKRVFCVLNPHPEEGIASSMKIGLTTAGCLVASEFRSYVGKYGQVSSTPLEDSHVLVCFVADEPYLQEDTINAFLDGFKASGKSMGAISVNGKTYNPCCFRDDRWAELSELEGDTGGKQLIRLNPEDVYLYPLPEERAKEVEDIDYKRPHP